MRWLPPPLVLCLIPGFLWSQTALRITSPGQGAPVNPGQSITVKLSIPPGISAQDVAVIIPELVGLTPLAPTPPYQVSIQIPADASLGKYQLGVVRISTGKISGSEPVSIDIERPDPPVSLTSESQTLHISPGDRLPLRVVAIYRDGTSSDVTKSTSTTYVSKSRTTADINSDGVVIGVKPGTTEITVKNAGVTAPVIPVTVENPVSIRPTKAVLYASQTVQFAALLSDESFGPVKWSISPEGAAHIDAGGLFTAPNAIRTRQEITVTATSGKNDAWTASSRISLYPPLTLDVAPNAATLGPSQSKQFSVSINNDFFYNPGFQRVKWSIEPAIGIIDGAGLYTAPPVISGSQSVVVTATSFTNPLVKASAAIKLHNSQ